MAKLCRSDDEESSIAKRRKLSDNEITEGLEKIKSVAG
jgi:hypothetical protein